LRPGQGKSMGPYLKDKLKQKGVRAWLKRKNTCLAGGKP
jgi:hypothetical protein